MIRLLLVLILWTLSLPAAAQYMVNPGAYGNIYGWHSPFAWGSGRYWGSYGGYAPGPRYYGQGAYQWNGFSRWRYRYGY
jgi:hypothetical protein